jgi:hypothetical protein
MYIFYVTLRELEFDQLKLLGYYLNNSSDPLKIGCIWPWHFAYAWFR